MKKVAPILLAALFLSSTVSNLYAADDTKETDRVQNAGQVMTEILSVPDDIPQDLLSKAYCIVVLPSVLKAAFIVGASYGRGVMTCRSGANFEGPWTAPTMMALEGEALAFKSAERQPTSSYC
jgi:lipid-binding SYLF domain-containing protein